MRGGGGIHFWYFSFSKNIEFGMRGISQGGRKQGGEQRRLVRSRSYPGFSIGILLSVKVILPVNSVFIPLLNEIHRSMETEKGEREREREREREMRERERERGRERERDMTKRRESNSSLSLSLLSLSPSFLPPVGSTSDVQ